MNNIVLLPTVPQPLTKVISNGLNLYRRARFKMLPLSTIYSLVLLSNLFIDFGSRTTVMVWYFVVTYLVNLYFCAGLFVQARAVWQNQPEPFRKVLLITIKKYLRCLIAGMAYFVLTYLGLLLLLLPGIFVGVILMLFIPNIMFNDSQPFDAIKRSFNLIKGNWWRSFAVIFVPIIIILLVFVFFVLIINLLHSLIGTSFSSGLQVFYFFILLWLAFVWLMPMFFTLLTCLHHDLSLRNKLLE